MGNKNILEYVDFVLMFKQKEEDVTFRHYRGRIHIGLDTLGL